MQINLSGIMGMFSALLSKRGKFLLNCAGSIVAIMGVVFVASRLTKYSSQVDFDHISNGTVVYLISVTVIYGISSLLLGCIWKNILSFCGETKGYLWSIRIYGFSQLAKYVPGNIFHFAGRQAIGMASNAGAVPLAKSTLYELILLVGCGSLFSIITLPLIFPFIPLPVAVIFFIVLVFSIYAALRKLATKDIADAFSLQLIFLLISGLTFVVVLSLTAADFRFSPSSALLIGSAFITAWLIGLVTPGAPAGLGVRELVILFFLKSFIRESDLLLAIVISRIVTVSGDLVFFGLSTLISKRYLRA